MAPPGQVMPILREGDHAPGLPPGVFIKNLYFSQHRICETGQIVATAELGGPGIVPGVNDYALFIGNPRKGQPLTKLFQLGDPAPGVATNPELAGLTLGSDGGTFFGAEQSDNGTLALFALLKGPGIPAEVYHQAVWTGSPDDLRLVYRLGMPAPGLPPGVTFAWADLPSINDLGQLAFRGLVQGPGITDDNDMGRWIGGPGDLQLYTAAGVPAPQQDSGVTFVQGGGGGHSPLNNLGDCGDLALVQGRGIGPLNDRVLYGGPPGGMTLVMQEGDLAPEAGGGVEIDSIGSLYVNDDANAWYRVRYRGLGIDDSNEWAMYLGLLGNPLLSLRDGDPAPTFQRDVVLSRVVAASSLSALNDAGDVVTVTEISGLGVTPTDKVVLWMRDTAFGGWYPLLRGGQAIGSRVASIPTSGSLSGVFWQLTGGADGYGLSFNDQRQLATKIPFTDGTEGLFVIELAR